MRDPMPRPDAPARANVLLWPLYAPLAIRPGAPWADEATDALVRTRPTPLAPLLPNEATMQTLARRLDATHHRVDELEALLARPAFSLEAAQTRAAELAARGSEGAAHAARGRAAHLERLVAMRDHAREQLCELTELVGQLRVQIEVVNIAGASDDDTPAFVADLIAHLAHLDAALVELGGARSQPLDMPCAPE